MFWSSNSDKPITPDSDGSNVSSLENNATSDAPSPYEDLPTKERAVQEKIDRSIASFPDTMSCQMAFEQAARCNGAGGRLRNNYRYGSMKACGPLWTDFWFCMRTRGMPGDMKRSAIQENYRKKEVEFLLGPNSEDIWEERTKPLERFAHLDPDLLLPQNPSGLKKT